MQRFAPADFPSTIFVLIWHHTGVLQVLGIALALIIPLLAVIPLELQRRIVDEAIPGGKMAELFTLAGAYLGIAAAAALGKYAVFTLRGVMAARIARAIRDHAMAAHAERSPAHARGAIGPLTAVLGSEADDLGGFAAEALNTPLMEGGSLLMMSGFLLWASPGLAALGLGVLLLQAAVVSIIQRRINGLTRWRINALRRANAVIADHGTGGQSLRHEALAGFRRVYHIVVRLFILKGGVKAFLKFSDTATTAAILCMGGALVIAGETTLGVIVAFLTGLGRIREPWHGLLDYYRMLSDTRIKFALVRVAQVADLGADIAALEADAVRDQAAQRAGRGFDKQGHRVQRGIQADRVASAAPIL